MVSVGAAIRPPSPARNTLLGDTSKIMSRPTIIVDRLGKSYRLGSRRESDTTFREALYHAFRSPLRRIRRPGDQATQPETFWALKDVSFEVGRGEVVGIIGRNGAGKSTLLKILSRITEPTEGCVRFRGRVASLLEVGTGFHPELTGRENVYLNGSILGMRKAEIDRKFDEIVAFAEVERFLDTQVKHFSSGMYVRLAFAVAAHLDPQILIVDEVLAVGDMAFQKKCLGKMEQVAGGGRTVLFVSHNMPVVISLCQRAMLIKEGTLAAEGEPEEVVRHYYDEHRGSESEVCDLMALNRSAWINGGARFLQCRLTTPDRVGPWSVPFGSRVSLEITATVTRPLESLEFGLALMNSMGLEIASPMSSDVGPRLPASPGEYTFAIGLPTLKLTPGRYYLEFVLRSDHGTEDHVTEAVFFEVLPNGESSEALTHHRRGSVIPDFDFSIDKLDGFK
jgi:lipopolysaccharide transport system ATP-binding protein